MTRALITGGANGLGRVLATHYLQHGSHVTILDIDTDRGRSLAQTHDDADFLPADLAAFDNDMLPATLAPLDLVICNAGISVSGDFAALASEREEAVFAINCLGHVRLIKRLLRERRLNSGARLVFICSATTFLPFPIAVSYAASKAALDGFAAALEPYVRGAGMSVTRVYPGPLRTSHARHYAGYDQGRGIDPERILPAIVRGVARRKRRVLPDRASRLLYLGSLVPGLLPRLAHRQYRDHLGPPGLPEDTAS